MKNWTVRQRILASFAVIIAIMLLMAATAYVKMLTVEKGAYRVQDDAMPGMYFITLVRSSWTDNYLQTQELFGITDDHELSKAEADSILASEERLDQQIASYQKTMNPDEARDHELLAGFQAVRKNYLEQHDKVLELYREKRFEEAGKLVAGPLTEHWREGRKYLNEMIELNKDIADRASDNIVNAVDDAELSMLVTLLLAVVVAGICGFLLLRAITQPIQKIVRSLDLMAGGDLTARLNLGRRDEFGAIETGFNGMAEELKGLVSQAQRSSVQVTTSVTEIAATSRDLVRTMSEVSGAAEQTSTLAGSGQLGLARMEETMHHVMGAADLVNAKLAILNEKAGNINQVVTTIVKVADQTNLLSLNAAIEAEKAGEYGRGFAVVATEVRRLADQTAVATYDIEQMVREIQSAVSAGVMGMDKFSEEVRRGIAEVGQVGEQLSQIIQQVQALAPRVQMVNEGMQAQATGAEQINQALVQLGEATGQTVESLRQASFAIDELNLVANGLRNGVSRFKV
ncbi:Wsp signal transduction system chemoreceptor WspA [Pseudomonas aeruginosa]|uniref:Wsp signal transduction system chemoreceptor WspA n=1 Tax=Pseudomonas aeruginosa TaxID=287 RepID=UPI000A205B1F|nr:Wsp signal transduction system chemoreceptor WspA [Pseudomonas aeruginosa]ARN33971.1 chemotaxis protein [Pseudomonas aeruginosa]MDA3251623.1 Wsp signal transduction system chemoreceptor WspA [Pseudomonas aeruginosa]RPY12282.1 methyl-accepting chemotaxis protein [Pseudomonas aeruginosa]HCF2732218.1 Wsp signal transduction system chemoreceptor WspA [Pseudomonas aeruginosa]HEO1595926.1 Wsp signal transduction system chemoreceptor WspA [Pseudomonas aeruginosa]